MEGGPHKLALALFASVNIHLNRLDDPVVFGEIFALGHTGTVGADSAGRQQTKAAKVGRHKVNPEPLQLTNGTAELLLTPAKPGW